MNRRFGGILFGLQFLFWGNMVFAPCRAEGSSGLDTMHFIFTSNTGGNYSLVVQDISGWGNLAIGDELGVFDGNLCVGAIRFEGSFPLALVAWRDDPQTPSQDGYFAGDTMQFRLWDSDLSMERDLVPSYLAGDGTFENGAYSILVLVGDTSPVYGEDDSIEQREILLASPSPFNARTSLFFRLLEGDFVSLKIYDVAGRFVAHLVDSEWMNPGLHQIPWNGLDDEGLSLPSGVYLGVMNTTTVRGFTRVVLIK